MSAQTEDTLPEADRIPGAPHPRETMRLHGQAAAEAAFLAALTSGRMPHGWLLAGPRGVGKATFAWRAARHLLATQPDAGDALFAAAPPETLDIDPDHPVARRIRALSEPNLLLLRRGWDAERKRLKTQLTVEEVRGLKGFFHMSAGGARRVVIVDSADEMNASAANALLKELEEPPANAVLLLVAHQPSALLPTIRSRCRTLRFEPLGPEDLSAALEEAGIALPEGASARAVTVLSGGSAGAAIGLIEQGGASLYADLVALMGGMPGMDRPAALTIAETAGGRAAEDRFDLVLGLIDTALARVARAGATGAVPDPVVPGEEAMLGRLAPDPHAARSWAELAASLTARARQGRAVNLDPAALIFDTLLDLDRTAARLAVPAS